MSAVTKLMTAGGGGVALTPSSSIASDVTVQVPSQNCTLSIQGPAFSAYADVDQSLTSAVSTKLNFAVEIFDTNNNFASSRFTPTVAGYYQLNTTIRISGTNLTNISAYFYKNGSVYSQPIQYISAGYSTSFNAAGSNLIYFNGSTDYVEVYVNITGTSPIMNWTNDNITSTFSGCLMRAA